MTHLVCRRLKINLNSSLDILKIVPEEEVDTRRKKKNTMDTARPNFPLSRIHPESRKSRVN